TPRAPRPAGQTQRGSWSPPAPVYGADSFIGKAPKREAPQPRTRAEPLLQGRTVSPPAPRGTPRAVGLPRGHTMTRGQMAGGDDRFALPDLCQGEAGQAGRTARRPRRRPLRGGLPIWRPGRVALHGPRGRLGHGPLGRGLLLPGVLRRGDGGGAALHRGVPDRHRGG